MLTARRDDGLDIDADVASRDGQHVCPECGGVVVLNCGRFKIAHFKHYRRPETCSFWGESEEHLAAKKHLRNLLIALGYEAQCEKVFRLEDGSFLRADIVATNKSGRQAAFEVQWSKLPAAVIERRTKAYAELGLPFCWVAILSSKELTEADNSASGKVLRSWRRSPWRRYVAALNYRRGPAGGTTYIWFIDPLTGKLWRGEMTRLRNVNGSVSKRSADLWLCGPYGSEQVYISPKKRPPYPMEALLSFLPECYIMHFGLTKAAIDNLWLTG